MLRQNLMISIFDRISKYIHYRYIKHIYLSDMDDFPDALAKASFGRLCMERPPAFLAKHLHSNPNDVKEVQAP